mgnify:CR=1 FL=1
MSRAITVVPRALDIFEMAADDTSYDLGALCDSAIAAEKAAVEARKAALRLPTPPKRGWTRRNVPASVKAAGAVAVKAWYWQERKAEKANGGSK